MLDPTKIPSPSDILGSNSIPSPSDILGGNEKKTYCYCNSEKLASATPIGSSGGAGFLRLTQIVLLQEWVNNLL
jgi:hypothetical protein